VAKRTYHQYCGLAAALDVVGERWALLVVRDLGLGPRRFNDLFAGLPGIATDVLAARLRSLEAAGVVQQRQLRYPVPANMYELTPYGVELAAITRDLARWGRRLLPPPGTQPYRIEVRWALQSMVAAYTGDLADGSYGFRIDGDEFTVVVAGEVATACYGPGEGVARLTIIASADAFFDCARNPAAAGRKRGDLEVTGDRKRAVEVFRSLPLTVGG
jgi:DNA-binding HxlR family transcriptional regulator